MRPFPDRLRAAQAHAGSCLCVGLDPDPDRMPEVLRGVPPATAIEVFCTDIIRAAATHACAFKPHAAFFEAHGAAGWAALERVIAAVRQHAPLVCIPT